jgi:NAD(P)-dependent dehydrogenase (short-subunit alcohol dehydrogenase family)
MSIPSSPRAVVTGAASGLGRAFCVELARLGAKVLASDIDVAGAEETVGLLRAGGRTRGVEAHAVRCDVSKLEDVQALADEADRRLGGVDVVVNNAGVAVGGRIGDIPIEDWRWLMGVNLWGVIHGCHVFLPRLRAQGRGHIVNVASAAGLLGFPGMAPYCVSKYGVVALSEALAGELAANGRGLGVTVLCPTFLRTNIHRNARATGDPKIIQVIDKLMDRSKLTAEDVARFALERARAGDLYALPHADGRWMWRLKRLVPDGWAKLMPQVMKRRARKLGIDLA